MNLIQRATMLSLGSVLMIGAASAAEMTGDEIKALISGKSSYLESTATSTGGAGAAVLYYAADGTTLYKTGRGNVLHGSWVIKGNLLCITWKEVPNNACSKLDKTGDTVSVINS